MSRGGPTPLFRCVLFFATRRQRRGVVGTAGMAGGHCGSARVFRRMKVFPVGPQWSEVRVERSLAVPRGDLSAQHPRSGRSCKLVFDLRIFSQSGEKSGRGLRLEDLKNSVTGNVIWFNSAASRERRRAVRRVPAVACGWRKVDSCAISKRVQTNFKRRSGQSVPDVEVRPFGGPDFGRRYGYLVSANVWRALDIGRRGRHGPHALRHACAGRRCSQQRAFPQRYWAIHLGTTGSAYATPHLCQKWDLAGFGAKSG